MSKHKSFFLLHHSPQVVFSCVESQHSTNVGLHIFLSVALFVHSIKLTIIRLYPDLIVLFNLNHHPVFHLHTSKSLYFQPQDFIVVHMLIISTHELLVTAFKPFQHWSHVFKIFEFWPILLFFMFLNYFQSVNTSECLQFTNVLSASW